jgi:pimeloyl-ACP methyl ester carboxylesterase
MHSNLRWTSVAFTAAVLAVATGCATAPTPPAPTYVLVHGAFQDSRAWNAVVPLLKAKGISAVAVNLPGRAADGTPLEAATLDGYRDAVLKVVNAQPGPVVLVEHSFGGITISNVAEAAPERIKTLVYVAAYLPAAGAADQSMAKMAEQDQWNQFNKARQNFLLAKDYKSASVLEADQLLLFCADCAPAAQQATLAIMQREPLAPAATPVQLTAARFGVVDKVYIHTTRDNAVSYKLQQTMVARTPVRKTMTLASGHSPFIEAPRALADALVAVSQ